MFAAGDVLVDVACSSPVRAAVQAVFPGARLRTYDIDSIVDKDHIALNQSCAVILGLRDKQGVPSTVLIERLRAIAPHVGVFVIEERRDVLDPWLLRLAKGGADDAFALDRPGDEKILRTEIANRVALPPPELALRKLWSLWTDCPLRVEAMYCVRNGYRPRHRFAPHTWFGYKLRTMRTKFDHAGLPTPLFLTRFGRGLHWKESLTRGGLSRIALATLLGFETLEDVRRERFKVRKRAARWPPLLSLLG